MVVAKQRCWVDRLIWKGSRTLEILQDSKNERHDTWNIFMLFKYDF